MIIPLIFGGQLAATKMGISVLPMPIPKLIRICSSPTHPTMNTRSIKRIEYVRPIFSKSTLVKMMTTNVERNFKFMKVTIFLCFLFPDFPFSKISEVMTTKAKSLRLAITTKTCINKDNVQLIEIDENITTNIDFFFFFKKSLVFSLH